MGKFLTKNLMANDFYLVHSEMTVLPKGSMKSITPVSIAIFIRNIGPSGFELWMQKRECEGSLNGLWEFPGGKVHSVETQEEAARREVLEEVGIHFTGKLLKFKDYPYSYEEKNIILFPFIGKLESLEEKGKWFKVGPLKSAPLEGTIPPVNHFIIDDLWGYLESQSQYLDKLWT